MIYLGLSINAPIRIATEKSMFAMPETAIGFFTDVGSSYFLTRLKDNVSYGLYLGVTGHRLKAKELVKWGVATNYVDSDKIPDLYEEVIQTVNSHTNFEEIKAIVDNHSDNTEIDDDFNKTIEYCFKPDSIHKIKARLEDVASGKISGQDQEFAQKTLDKMSKFSPIACAIVVEHVKRVQSMSLEEAFVTEYGVSRAIFDSGEFYEGVRALLVDKDNKPK